MLKAIGIGFAAFVAALLAYGFVCMTLIVAVMAATGADSEAAWTTSMGAAGLLPVAGIVALWLGWAAGTRAISK